MLAAALLLDLICTAPGADMRYRIDLFRGEYCAGDCAVVRRLSNVTETMIVIADEQKLHSDDTVRLEQVDRATWHWHREVSVPPLYQPMVTDGTCRMTTFSGFPQGAVRD